MTTSGQLEDCAHSCDRSWAAGSCSARRKGHSSCFLRGVVSEPDTQESLPLCRCGSSRMLRKGLKPRQLDLALQASGHLEDVFQT